MTEIHTAEQRWAESLGTAKELDKKNAMQSEIDELRAFIGDLPEAQNELLKINKANMAENTHLKELLSQALGALQELHASIKGECPSLLNEDSGGNAGLDIKIETAITDIEKAGIK